MSKFGKGGNTLIKNLFGYCHNDRGSTFLTDFNLIAGKNLRISDSTENLGCQRLHKTLLVTLSPLLRNVTEYDMILLPHYEEITVHNLANFIYTGRYVWSEIPLNLCLLIGVRR